MTEQTVERREPELLPTLSRSRSIPGWDLLQWRWVRRWVHHPIFPTIFQLPLLILFVAFAIAAWGYYTPEGVPGKLYGQANLVNLAVWGAVVAGNGRRGNSAGPRVVSGLSAGVAGERDGAVGPTPGRSPTPAQQRAARGVRHVDVVYGHPMVDSRDRHPSGSGVYLDVPVHHASGGGGGGIRFSRSRLLPRFLRGRVAAADLRSRGHAGGASDIGRPVRGLCRPGLCEPRKPQPSGRPQLPESVESGTAGPEYGLLNLWPGSAPNVMEYLCHSSENARIDRWVITRRGASVSESSNASAESAASFRVWFALCIFEEQFHPLGE